MSSLESVNHISSAGEGTELGSFDLPIPENLNSVHRSVASMYIPWITSRATARYALVASTEPSQISHSTKHGDQRTRWKLTLIILVIFSGASSVIGYLSGKQSRSEYSSGLLSKWSFILYSFHRVIPHKLLGCFRPSKDNQPQFHI